MKWVLVTGCEGYIGSILCKRLKESGYAVIGVDNTPNPVHKATNVDLFLNECFSSNRVVQHINEYNVQTVYHLAAHSLLGPSAYEPARYYENNAGRTAKLLEKLHNVNFIYASTAAVYAEQATALVESDRKGSPNVYGRSKYMCEQMLEDVAPAHKINAVSFRFFNVIGAYGNLKQKDSEPHLLNQIYQCLKAQKVSKKYGLPVQPLNVYGHDYNTRDGSCVRDFVHVLDICEALIHAGRITECDEHNNQFANKHTAYNLASGNGTSVLEMIQMVNSVTSIPIEYKLSARRVGDPAFLVADPRKFIEDTGFKYQYTIKQAIQSVME